MSQVLTRPLASEGQSSKTSAIPVPDVLSRLRPPPSRNGQINVDTFSPVNENGSFEFDRVLKTGRVSRRVKHKHVFRASWKPAYLVLRPNLLSVYKDEETTRLRVSISLSEVTAVAPVKSPRSNRKHVFGIFTPSKNYRFEALSERDAEDWITRIRGETPADEDEAAFLALSRKREPPAIQKQLIEDTTEHSDFEGASAGAGRASSPELGHRLFTSGRARKPPYTQDYSGNEITSYSELSDNGGPPTRNSRLRSMPSIHTLSLSAPEDKPMSLPRDTSRQSDLALLRDPERVVCQGYLQGLRIKGTVRQWKRLWVVLRPKSLAFYKDDQEYSAIKIISMSQVIDAAEVDPMSRSKTLCMQIIAEEKTYRLCAPDEESLARWLGSLKSIIVARKKLEAGPSAV
ncbi:PH domain protein [Penicillium brasilianum]|uniref:PH domain protein n=1 Tax=Penicillium brasilianum TaxID=104259 RepID=A0A1S9RV46_PENBI|nr:PH domain protein [Penicillium brasilianum]